MTFKPRNAREAHLYEKCIKLPDLKHNTNYLGECRNSTSAIWNKGIQKFEYTRYKFNTSFIEEIEHPDNDKGYDVFFPLKESS